MKRKSIFKYGLLLVFLFVTFFSLYLNCFAANFNYSDFDWDELLEQNKNFWTESCGEDKKCDEVLKTKKKFYTRLYKLLDSATKKYGYIDDNLIIAVSFYELDPDTFNDPGEGSYNSYNIDEDAETENKYIGDDGGDKTAAKDYFEKETDTLKTLVNSFIGYSSMCYGLTNEKPTTSTDSDGNTIKVCSTQNYEVEGDTCIARVSGPYKSNFFESIGLITNKENLKKCEQEVSDLGFANPELRTSGEKQANEEFFWDYLENSTYFDYKDHLQHYFDLIYSPNGCKNMKEFYEKADHDPKLLEKYNEKIINVRKHIISNIKNILETYGKENFSNVSKNLLSATSNKYWWPIGSSETTDADGVLMATGDPESLEISSEFGLRTHPVTGEANSNHLGVDIPGVLNVTNVIASKDGVVVKTTVNDSIVCQDNGDASCGSGYGNYIIIEHIDGNYTLYAHLAEGSITVNVGDSVKQGQVIAKVGNSGSSTGAHLHFEVRVGSIDKSSVVNPLNYISKNEPRPVGTSSEILEWIGNMEGTGPVEGNSYKIYADSGGVLTVGHGITLVNNADLLRAHGIDPNSLKVGSLVDKNVIDQIYAEEVSERLTNIKGLLSTNGLSLNDNQIAALASLQYNCGNINGFFEAYNKYGSNSSLCTNWWEQKALHDQRGNYLSGLKKRRIAECDLFVNGNFNMNVYG